MKRCTELRVASSARCVLVAVVAALTLGTGCRTVLDRLAAPATGGALPTTAGTYDRALDHDGMSRTYRLHIPAGYDGATAMPVLFMLHGSFGSAEGASIYYGWREKADAEGFIAVFPQGAGAVPTWNAAHCCGFAQRRDVDDVGFIAAILDELSLALSVDAKRVYATGMSNGAMLCHRLAGERADLFAAIGPVAGTVGGERVIGAPQSLPPAPGQPVAVIVFHGTEDNFVRYGGGVPKRGALLGRVDEAVPQSVQFWQGANGCDATPLIESLGGGDVVRETYACPAGADVVLYTIIGGGHAWPGGQRPRPRADAPSCAINATDTIWEFFEAHPKP